MRGERIVLPPSLSNRAIRKAHQGGHPGESNLKRRLRMHFWFPDLNEKVHEQVKRCPPRQANTNKPTKEPQAALRVPQKQREEVALDLFGPMPTGKHILVAQDILPRFPEAHIVPSTNSQAVLPALDDIYTNFGYPEQHLTDNGPPFNSAMFQNYSLDKGIDHKTIYPYHPQANPAERFMKPLGKSMKTAHFNKQNDQQALNAFLEPYRATPNIATGVTPGD